MNNYSNKHIAIIGGGITGLTVAFELAKQGYSVTLFEKEKTLGGLAAGFKKTNWQWHLEKFYHHLFTNDNHAFSLIKELGMQDKLIVTRPVTSNYTNGRILPFDSPLQLLRFPYLSVSDKLRTGVLISFLKLNPFWKPLECIYAKDLFVNIGGKNAWKTIWEPLMISKFGKYYSGVPASWLWARIKKRTPSLCYIRGGFQTLINKLEEKIKDHGGQVYTNCEVEKIRQYKNGYSLIICKNLYNKRQLIFDKILITIPSKNASTMLSKLTSNQQLTTYNLQLNSIPHLHAQTLVLETDEPILKDACPERSRRACPERSRRACPERSRRAYWLNITDRSFPFLAVVAHTNFIDKKYYGGKHITYIGNYLPDHHPYLKMNKNQLLKLFAPYIKRVNPTYNLSRRGRGLSAKSEQPTTYNLQLFTGFYAQPVHSLNYSKIAPKLATPVPNIYLANMDSIYPWDRGINYAVELGNKTAKIILLN